MIKRFLIGAGLLIAVISGGYFSWSGDNVGIGTELPGAPALFETSLAAPITASADSFTLTSNYVRGGGSLSGYNCFTLDEGSAQAEFVCGTASGTAITGVTRGISPSDGVSEIEDLKFAHRRGASVKITDFPIIQLLRNQNNGEATFENVLRYAGSVVPSSADELADVGYVLSVVNGGTVNFDALVVAGTAGETISTSTLVYFKASDQRWWKVDTDDTTTFQNVPLGLSRGDGTAGSSVTGGGVLLRGLQTGLSGLTAGSTYYASSSAGNFNTATSVLPIGIAKSTTELHFDPVILDVPRLGMNNTFTGTNRFTGLVTGIIDVTTYTSSSTFTKVDGLQRVFVQAWGGGGGGASTNVNANETGGGGGGMYVEAWFEASDLSTTTTITIGSGGLAVSGDNDGNVGGTTTFGSLLTAYGGGGGGSDVLGGGGGGGGCYFSAGISASTSGSGPAGSPGSPFCIAGGEGSSANIILSGSHSGGGGQGYTTNAAGVNGSNSFYGGAGGGGSGPNNGASGGTSVYGGNGGAANNSASGNATAGAVPGGGGGAKWSNGGSGSSGAGGNGMVIVTSFY